MIDKISSLEYRLGIPQSYAASTGYFLLAFSLVEDNMNRAIWELLKLRQDRGGYEITTAIRDFGQRMRLLAKLGKALLDTERDRQDCSKLIKALQFINDVRVQLVHGTLDTWQPGEDWAYLKQSWTQSTRIQHKSEKFTSAYLVDLADYALATNTALIFFGCNFSGEPYQRLPSLDKRPELHPPQNDSQGESIGH